MPTGRRHWLRDNPATPTTELEDILARTPLDEHHRLHYGGRGARTGLLCGGFVLQGGTHPVLRALPATASLAEIAARAGYGTEFSFGRAFKRTFGVSPGAYRGQPDRVSGLSPAPDAAALAR